MTLSDYIAEKFGGNVAAFARHMGRRQSTVRRWLLPPTHKDYRAPRREAVADIYDKTGGLVTPQDHAPPVPVLPDAPGVAAE